MKVLKKLFVKTQYVQSFGWLNPFIKFIEIKKIHQNVSLLKRSSHHMIY